MSDIDPQFEKLKGETERELGRPLEPGEEHYLKGLLFFSRGCKLKSQLPASEPQHIRDILPDVMRDIEQRVEQRRRRQGNVIEAVKGFLAGQRKPGKGHTLKVRSRHVRE